MQTVSSVPVDRVAPCAFAARAMLLSRQGGGAAFDLLRELGCRVEVETEFYAALSGVIDDPLGYDLFVMDCDGFGGIDAAERAVSTLIASSARMRVILISRDFDAPAYPMGRRSAVSLPANFSQASFRIGFDHVLRDRVVMQYS